jgi:polyphosphate kinase 2 (PPK2 family)
MTRREKVDLSLSLSKRESTKRIIALQRRLLHLGLVNAGLIGAGPRGPGLCVVFEGWDASGKGGSIKRLVNELDPRHVVVAPFAAPTENELRHHFLWRFAPALPGRGEMTVFDRSWYGRVLVERVEGFATPEEVERAYDEIVGFEHGLVEEGTVLVKVWLEISPDEQLHRFEARRDDPLRSWKLTADDWRNREKRPAYEEAVDVMLKRTDHRHAPWEVIAGEDKHYARVAVLEAVVSRFEAGMRRDGIEPPPSTGADFGTT